VFNKLTAKAGLLVYDRLHPVQGEDWSPAPAKRRSIEHGTQVLKQNSCLAHEAYHVLAPSNNQELASKLPANLKSRRLDRKSRLQVGVASLFCLFKAKDAMGERGRGGWTHLFQINMWNECAEQFRKMLHFGLYNILPVHPFALALFCTHDVWMSATLSCTTNTVHVKRSPVPNMYDSSTVPEDLVHLNVWLKQNDLRLLLQPSEWLTHSSYALLLKFHPHQVQDSFRQLPARSHDHLGKSCKFAGACRVLTSTETSFSAAQYALSYLCSWPLGDNFG